MDYEIINNDTDRLLQKLEKKSGAIKRFDSYTIYRIILFSIENEKFKNYVKNNLQLFINKICEDFNLLDNLSLFTLLKFPECHDEVNKLLKDTTFSTFNNCTKLFINKINNEIINKKYQCTQEIYNCVFKNLEEYDNDRASTILFDLNILLDFKDELEKRYGIVETLIAAYQKYNSQTMIDNHYKGSSIVGCLMKDDNQYLATEYMNKLLKNYHTNLKRVTCIGGGSTCLVFKVGKSVIKLGETRNSRQIYVNHRILASQVRKLLKNGDKELFYVEIMKYIKHDDITKEEVDELQEDLLNQGLIWEDAKIENCGVLDYKDANISKLPIDYENVAGKIDNPFDREQFMKRKRKVVVLDNDNIRLNPKANWK